MSRETAALSLLAPESTRLDFDETSFCTESPSSRIAIFILRSLGVASAQIGDRRMKLLSTIEYFKKLFGDKRLERALSFAKIDSSKMHRRGSLFTKKEVAHLLHILMLVTKDDVNELLNDLRSSKEVVRGLEGALLEQYRAKFKEKESIESCSFSDVSQLLDLLLPSRLGADLGISSSERDVLHFPKNVFNKVKSAAWISSFLHEKVYTVIEWAQLVGKNLSRMPIPKGLLIPHPDRGFLFLSHTIQERGASKYFFRSLDVNTVFHHTVYQGTRGVALHSDPRDLLHCFADDARREIGAAGSIATYNRTKELFENPQHGFVDTSDDRICGIGYSLGGVQLQRDALLFPERFHSITTICSPGIEAESAQLFTSMIEKSKSSPTIDHIFEEGDIIANFGEKHLGAGCEKVPLTFRTVRPIGGNSTSWPRVARLIDFIWRSIRSLFMNLFDCYKIHARATIAQLYDEIVLGQDEVNAQADHSPSHVDPLWEKVRQRFCLPSPGFAHFVRQQIGVIDV